MSHIAAAILDLDGTQALTEHQRNRPANVIVAARYGARLVVEDWKACAGTSEAFIHGHLAKKFNGFADRISPKQYQAEVEAEFYRTMKNVEVRPGMVDVFNHLKARQILLATGTNSPREIAMATLQHTGQLHDMATVVTKCDAKDAGRPGKPAPDIFLMAAAKLNVNPADCLYIDDASKGVEAALQALNSTPKRGSGYVIQVIDAHDEDQFVPHSHKYVAHPDQLIHVRNRDELVRAVQHLVR